MHRTAIPLAVVIALTLPALGHASGVRTLFEVQGDGVSGNIQLNNPFLNANGDALLLAGAADFNQDLGLQVSYSVAWYVDNNSVAAFPSDAHIWVLGFDSASGFRHTTTGGNTTTYYTVLDDARLNNHPEARPLVTREGTGGHAAVPYPFAVEYDVPSQRWRIRYENTTHTMPTNATFSVFVPDADDWTYIHTTTAGNTNANYTIFNPAGIDSSHQYRMFMTPVLPGTINDEWIGAAWLFSNLIGNVDGTTMPEGAVFHVFVPPLFEDGFETGNRLLWSAAVP